MDDNTIDQLYEFGKCEKRTDLNFSGIKVDDSSEYLYVYFTDQEILKVIHLRAYKYYVNYVIYRIVEGLLAENYNHAIIILRNKPQHFVQAAIAKLSGKIDIELFQDTELLMDITEYFLVPEHILLTSQEAIEVEKQIKSSRNKLPRLRLTDPITKYYGYKAGDVVKIIRPSDISGRYITYRVVL